jgi:Fur family ferric uptake transcriptional regulator
LAIANGLQLIIFGVILLSIMSNLQEYYKVLSQSGYRITPQRQMILQAIASAGSHISAEEIFERVCKSYPNIDLSTVYRTLELLSKLGLVTETDLGDGRKRFHSESKGHHHHLVCQKCGRVIDVDENMLEGLKRTFLEHYQFTADLTHMAFFGYCENCK